MTCNGDCNQGRECNCKCKMTKQTEALHMAIEVFDMYGNKMNSAFADEAYQACKEALAETQKPILIQWYDEEEDVWENTDERHYQHYADTGHKIRFLYTTPSREWVGLSDAEIEEAVNYLNVKIDYPIMFARLIEMHLKEKNNGT